MNTNKLLEIMTDALKGYSTATISYEYVKMLELHIDDPKEFDRRLAEYKEWAKEIE